MNYQVKDPQGNIRTIAGPDGASDDEVIAQAKRLFGAPQKPMSTAKRLGTIYGGILKGIPDSPATQIQQGLTNLGGNIAEGMGKRGYPKTGVALGAIPAFLPQALGMMSPESEASKISMFKPNIPAAMQEAVNAASEMGVPLTRAEKTGSMLSSGIESFLEKTPLGSKPIQQFRENQTSALDAAKNKLQGSLGTSEDLYGVGKKAQTGLNQRALTMRNAKSAMFDKIPDNVSIPLKQSRDVADTIIQEQSKFLPQTRNGDVTSLAQGIQDSEKALAAGQPNFPLIKRLREVLNARIEANNKGIQSGLPGQSNAVARDYTRLKSALDQDIQNYVSSQNTPLGSMVGKEFASSYKKANAFSGAYSNLFKSDAAKALADAPPEKVVDMVFKKNNETAIKQFRALAGEDGFQAAKKKFTTDLLNAKNLENELNKYKPGTLASIYTQPELTQLKKFGMAQRLSKGAEKVAGNPSGTARSVIAEGQYGGAGALALAGHPVAAASVLGTPYAAAKGYLSNVGRSGTQMFNPQTNKAITSIVAAILQRIRNANSNPQ